MSRQKSRALLDIVAFGAHPDDVELTCGGTIAKSARQGHRVGIVDATRGELGTRGTVATRAREAERASRILGVATRENLGLPDGYLSTAPEAPRSIVEAIRRLRPWIVIVPSEASRHPDHRALSRLVKEACFFSGLERWDAKGAPWRPRKIVTSTTYLPVPPSFLVDISDDFEVKLRAIRSFKSQIRGVDRLGDIFPSSRSLIDTIKNIHSGYGAIAQAKFAEPFLQHEVIVIDDLLELPLASV